MSEAPSAQTNTTPIANEKPPPTARRAGLSTMLQGLGFALAGIAALWISFRFGDRARTILGAGPLIGGGMMGYGAVQILLGDRLSALRWIVAVIAGPAVLGATVILLETTLGVTFA